MADVVPHGPSGAHRAEAVSASLPAVVILGWISAGLAASMVGGFLVLLTVADLGRASLLLYAGLLLALAFGAYGRGGRQLGFYCMGVVISVPCLVVALMFLVSEW
jgi:ABC-type sulfate transport system permease subunit